MAYCLRSLVQTLEQVLLPHQHHKTWILDHDKIPQIQSLFENASFFRDFFDESSPLIQERIASLEDQIMSAAEKAEDSLESHITRQIISSPDGQSIMISPPDLGEVIRVFEVAKEEVIKITDVSKQSDNSALSPPVSSACYTNSKNMVVGVKEDLIQLKSRLTAWGSELDIIPLVGMGGTGKTTLARILFDEYSSSKSHFDCCAWVTISQSYDLQLILKTILAGVSGRSLDEMFQQSTNEFIVALHKTLFGRRYLIVLDDIWICKAWDDVQRAFPRDNKRSRIILTTREDTVSNYVMSKSHEMHLINMDDSWELIRGKVFGEESCLPELEEIGKTIAKNCGGLPLALQVIGGLLAHSPRSEGYWEYVAHNISSLIAKTNDQFAGIFSWSFAHLPHYLKPCFLYMGAFPEDHEIRASKIIRMWIAEGFLYPIQDKSLEEAAEIHLNALVHRNLIFVRERKCNGKAKSYGIHDLLRDLCLKKAQEKKFLYVKDSKTDIPQEVDTLSLRRVSVHLSNEVEDEYGSLKLTPVSRSFLVTNRKESDTFMSSICYKSSLLRVLNVYQSQISEFQEVFLHLVNLRYLSLNIGYNSPIPMSISVLKNLQTLIVTYLESLSILVDLPQLRHLKIGHLMRTDGFPIDRVFDSHENLQTLSYIPHEMLVELLVKLPNLRKLWVNCENSNDNFDLTSFQKLEIVKCVHGFPFNSYTLRSKAIFPYSLKKLTMISCGLSKILLNAIGILPELQVLKLEFCDFENLTWEPSEGEFCQLQHLKLAGPSIYNWFATEIHFPVLRHLSFEDCYNLIEIPSEIGDIQTLELIEVQECKPSFFESATRILEEQCQFGNTLLQLRLDSEFNEDEDSEFDRADLKAGNIVVGI